MYHSSFIYSSVSGHLGCFHVLAIVNSAAMNIGVCIFLNCGLLRVLEKEMATHSSTLAWKIPWMEEPGRLQSVGLKESGMTEGLHFHIHIHITFIARIHGSYG